MRLWETLLLWNSKEMKCCLYETPYIAAPIRVLGDVIANSTPYVRLPTDASTRARISFSWFTSDAFCTRHILSYQDSYVKFYEEIYKQRWCQKPTTYRVSWGVPRRVLFKCCCKQTPLWLVVRSRSLRNLEEQDDRKKRGIEWSALTHTRHTHCTFSQLGTAADWSITFLGTDFKKRAIWQGSVEEPAAKDFVARKVRTIKWNEVLGTSWNAIKCKECLRSRLAPVDTQATINLINELEIPLGFLSQAVLHWRSGGLCHARNCQFEDLDEKKRYDLRSPNGRSHEKHSERGGTGKECQY